MSVLCVKIDTRNIFFTLELPPLCMVTEDEFSYHGIDDRKTLAVAISIVNPMTTEICFLLETLDILLMVATYPMAFFIRFDRFLIELQVRDEYSNE